VLTQKAEPSSTLRDSLNLKKRSQWVRRLRDAWPICLLLLIPLRDNQSTNAKQFFDDARKLLVLGDLEKCQHKAEQGFDRYNVSDPSWAVKFRLLGADTMVRRGMYDIALRSLADYRFNSVLPEVTVQKLAIEAVALTRQQQLPAAVQSLIQAKDLCRQGAYLSCGEVLRASGILAMKQGKFSEAQQFFHDTVRFADAHGDRFLAASAGVNLSWTALQVGHFDEALDWSRNAYRASTELGAEDLSEKVSGNLGWAYFNLGDRERAQELFLEAEESAARRGNIRSQLGWITTSGYVYQSTGNLERASVLYRQALALAGQIKSKEDITNSLEVLAHLSVENGKLDEARSYINQVAPLVQATGDRLDALDVLFARGRIAAAQRNDQQAEAIYRIVEKDPASQTSMRFGAEHELASLYEAQGNASSADTMYRSALTTFDSARAQLKNENSKLPFLTNATPVYDDYIHFLVTQGKSNQALAIADGSRARTLTQGLGVPMPNQSFKAAALHAGEIARKADATLLFYWLGEKQSYLWAITPTKTSLFPLPAQAEIAGLVKRYSVSLLGPNEVGTTANEDGLALYRILIEPARRLIRPGSTVVILNDGILSGLNFETLVVPTPQPHYFIEDATAISAPSLYMLASAKPSPHADNKLLLLGDAVSADPDYPELPMAAIEMRQIERHFAAADKTVFTRQQALSAAYLNSTPQQYSYIHFVAHGVASRLDPLDSAIILSRSSGAADSYKLYARDIVQHPIHARLVTISACSGNGTRSYAGEGLVGLSWAFLRAGAHNVIGALWEVSDDSTPRLMDALYQGIEDGLSPSAALRKAKLALLHSDGRFSRPFFWAPFQIYAGL
jgi:CHAT domain-containing protein/Flp pilus assembly protein TadD